MFMSLMFLLVTHLEFGVDGVETSDQMLEEKFESLRQA